MSRIILIYFIITIFCSSCSLIEKGESQKKDMPWIVTLKVIIPIDDEVEIFYNDSKNYSSFSEQRKLKKNISGSAIPQKIRFELPPESFSLNIRIDFGNDLKLDSITIKEIIFEKESRKMIIQGKDIQWYFYPNKYVSYSNNGVIKIIDISDKRDAFIVSNGILSKRLKIEL